MVARSIITITLSPRAMKGTVATSDRKQEYIDEEESRLAATPRSAVSFFSPRAASPSSRGASSAASPYSAHSPYNPPRMNMDTYTSTIPSDAPGSARYGPSPSPSSAIRSSPAPSFVSNNTSASNNSVSASAARPVHEPLDMYSPSNSPSPSPPTGRAGPSAGAGNLIRPGLCPRGCGDGECVKSTAYGGRSYAALCVPSCNSRRGSRTRRPSSSAML